MWIQVDQATEGSLPDHQNMPGYPPGYHQEVGRWRRLRVDVGVSWLCEAQARWPPSPVAEDSPEASPM